MRVPTTARALGAAVRLRPVATRACWLLAVVLAWPSTARPESYDPDGEQRPAPEAEVELPPFPRSENLLPFTVSST